MKKKTILVGPSASGKDYLMRELRQNGYKYKPKYTTRPMRKNESQNVEYTFIDNVEFQSMVFSNEFIVEQSFDINGDMWRYGITVAAFNEAELFVMTPAEIKQLHKTYRKQCTIVYLNIDESIRRERISQRLDNNDSIERRLQSDRIDFENFTDFDIEITDSSKVFDYFTKS